jgi:Tol biopolymer transport system component
VLSGVLRGPVGAQVLLRLNGAEEIRPSVAQPTSGALYGATPLSFTQPLPDGTNYVVALGVLSGGVLCGVLEGGFGTLPVAAGTLRVGCEFEHEHLARSSDGTRRADIQNGTEVVIGGRGAAEGRYVAFTSTSSNLAGATGGSRQVFWRDRFTGETRLVSASPGGAAGNNSSDAPAISADGQTVAFQSVASDLVAGDTNGVSDVFVWSVTGGLRRASVGPAGEQGNAGSFAPTLSGDGRIVAFASGASTLTPNVSGTSQRNIIRRDLTTGQNLLVSRAAVGVNAGNGTGGQWPAISEDGNRLAFWSTATDLVAGDTNGLWDIFVHDLAAGTLRRVSLTETGGERNGGTESGNRNVQPAISGNGRYVAYATTASNVVAGDSNGLQDLFVVDLDAAGGQSVTRVTGAGGVQGNGDSPKGQGERAALSFDGRWVAFSTNASNYGYPADQVLLVEWQQGSVRAATPANVVGTVYAPAISREAAYVAFGANRALDLRFAEAGLFAFYTGLAPAFSWRE